MSFILRFFVVNWQSSAVTLFVPPRIHQIIVSNLLVQFLGLLRVYLFDKLGGYACPDAARLDDGVAQYQGTGSHDGTFAHHGMVEEGGAHAYEGIVADGCPVHGDIVADGHVVADFYGRFLIQGVQHAAILDVHAVADADGVHVSAQHGVEPYAAVVSQLHVAYEGGVVRQETVLADFGGEAPYRFYQCHNVVFNVW